MKHYNFQKSNDFKNKIFGFLQILMFMYYIPKHEMLVGHERTA